MNKYNFKKLLFCVLLDAIGLVSFTIPTIGEFSDVVWAPLSAYIFSRMFTGKLGTYGSIFTFVEEALPFVDVVPTFTISWVYESFFVGTKKMPDKNIEHFLEK
ncbi:MAG: hypothetical protein KGV44_10230 [Flavobacteriaceae bacterium]|nr:hypothetical protein [Flavobacteriaceae bacterium]